MQQVKKMHLSAGQKMQDMHDTNATEKGINIL